MTLLKIFTTSQRTIELDRTLIMAILNATPDSFSDGGEFLDIDKALDHSEKLIADGADMIDIGGESTRPGSDRVDEGEELRRTIPLITAIKKRFDVPVSIDTSRSAVAAAAMDAGAEIINDISGLRFDRQMAATAAKFNAGSILMHSRGEFSAMHEQPPVDDILENVSVGLRGSMDLAAEAGLSAENIILDPGFGFGKSYEQNLELLARLDELTAMFPEQPFLVGVSRKSFIGKLLGDVSVDRRLSGSVAAAVIAAAKGANIIRVHDVKETVDALRVFDAVQKIS